MNINNHVPIVIGSVLASIFTIFGLSGDVFAEDEPEYLFGNLTNEGNLTKAQKQEIIDKVTNYTSTMKKEASGNETKLNVLLIEDLAKRNIIDEKAKQGLLSFIAGIPKSSVGTLPNTIPGNLTIPGNITGLFKSPEDSIKLLDDIAKNNSDSQAVTLMTDILKKRISDLGTVPGNGPVPLIDESTWADIGKIATCVAVGSLIPGGIINEAAGVIYCGLLV